jgi:hypothetical protein
VSVLAAALAALVMFLGAALQGAVGFGANLVAAPLLLIIDPDLVPAPVIMAGLVLNALVIRREPGVHHWRAMRWPIIGSVPGAVAGAAIVAVVDQDRLTVVFGVLVLIAVAISASGLHPRRTHRNLAVGGLLSGFMGTAVGIGGPPIALFFTRASGPEIRGALCRFFAAGSVLSLLLLGAFGQFTVSDVRLGFLLLPGTALGYLASGWLASRVEPQHVRVAVLVVSGASAILAIARVLL